MTGRPAPPAARGPVVRVLRALAVLALAAGGAACSSTEFEPVVPGDLGFSVWGYVDAGLDTQWVRVGRVRPSLAPDPEAFRASVTLVEVETGRRWPMRDSTFTFFDGYRAVNAWAAAPAEPGRRYRVEVEGDDGLRASAEAVAPPRPETFVRPAPVSDPARVVLYDVARVEDVRVTMTCSFPGRGVRSLVGPPGNVYRRGAGGRDTEVVVYWFRFGFGCRQDGGEVTDITLTATVLGDDWPDLRGVDFDGVNVPSATSNVTGGEGFFGGATTLRVPLFEAE